MTHFAIFGCPAPLTPLKASMSHRRGKWHRILDCLSLGACLVILPQGFSRRSLSPGTVDSASDYVYSKQTRATSSAFHLTCPCRFETGDKNSRLLARIPRLSLPWISDNYLGRNPKCSPLWLNLLDPVYT
jgi:hypothetical protein